MADVKPMMRQYYEVKEKAGDCILFFRLGDFYEMFDDDAKLVSQELDLTLTTRDRGKDESERVPMCGVPYHSAQSYIARLIAKGYKVAICEQTEDPKLAKGLVDRDIVRTVTPGTIMDDIMLDQGKNNYICAVGGGTDSWAACFADISTGEMSLTGSGTGSALRVGEELARYSPREAILAPSCREDAEVLAALDKIQCSISRAEEQWFEPSCAVGRVADQFGEEQAGLLDEASLSVCGALLSYLYSTQKTDLSHINKLSVYTEGQFMALDVTARQNLELCQTLRTKEKRGSLLWVLDRTRTPMGGRLIRSWIEKPLLSAAAIGRRLNAVQELKDRQIDRKEIIRCLEKIGDMERLIARTVYGSANGRDLLALANAIENIPAVKTLLGEPSCDLLKTILSGMDSLTDIRGDITACITDEPPFSLREGGIIRAGYDPEVDRLRDIMSGGKNTVASIENRERERTGIKKLRVGYNKVFGYYIEIPRAAAQEAPADYIRKQTLTNCERFINEELKALESSILTAEERVKALEYELFTALREKLAGQVVRVQATAAAVAQLDVLCSFAQTASDNGYCKPEVDYSDVIEITAGRHPVVEKMLAGGMFVPNDTRMNTSDDAVQIITGPNMAGKSTYMRQVALIVLMAHMGSFVPAASACIGVVDRIFTRVGASDDLASGRSTFMIEMTEVADILSNATKRSLLILDEIGRGTSTYDGMAIARAVVEHVSSAKLRARTLFSTHYHELTALEDLLPGVKNYNIAVKKRTDDIVFLRKIVRGGADDSYGIDVAKLAGLPDTVISRAKEILKSLEEDKQVRTVTRRTRKDAGPRAEQISMADRKSEEVMEKLRGLDLNTVTPIEAMNFLFELKKDI